MSHIFTGVSRQRVKLLGVDLVKVRRLHQDLEIPAVVEPAVDNLDLLGWLNGNSKYVERLLLEHKALLFRGFNIKTAEQFHQAIKLTSKGDLLEYRDRSSPRHEVAGKIYTSTDYPANYSIFPHNECSYLKSFPLKIYFCCLQVAQFGGETPIADTQKVLQLIDSEIVDKFAKKGVLYVRNYNDGFGLDWQTTFQTGEAAEVERYCDRNNISFEWKPGNRLKTWQIRPAIAKHPITGSYSWFNHAAFFHISTLETEIKEALLQEFNTEDLPHQTYYGDGSEIEEDALDKIRDAYERETKVFPWKAGDILMLDNMAIAHARKPFQGERKVLVGMAEPYSLDIE